MANEPWANAHLGKVISVKRWSDTSVSSYGGGGYVDPNFGGRVQSPKIKSTIVQRTEVFSSSENGREASFIFSDINVSLRDGSSILVVWGTENETETAPYLYVENLDTGENYQARHHDFKTTWFRGAFWKLLLLPPVIFFIFFAVALFFDETAISKVLVQSTAADQLSLRFSDYLPFHDEFPRNTKGFRVAVFLLACVALLSYIFTFVVTIFSVFSVNKQNFQGKVRREKLAAAIEKIGRDHGVRLSVNNLNELKVHRTR